MHYTFPVIRHLDDVRPAIEGRDEFIVAERPWGFVVNYMVNMPDTFPEVQTANDAIRRECRGILFYPDGRIMARRLHKFFNVNERDETQVHRIDLGQPHVILEKLDGSMITPVITDGMIRFGTKMGLTDVSAGPEAFVSRNPVYHDFCKWMMDSGYTPIFEWCSRSQRIVIDYPEDRLVLIAVRNTVTGEYESYSKMVGYRDTFGIDVVRAYEGTTSNMEHLIVETRDLKNAEGWVIRFDTGQMLKIKGDEYVRFHRTKDGLSQEKNVVDMLVNEKIDDTKAFMMDDDRHRVEEFERQFWHGFEWTAHQLFVNLQEARIDVGGDRKRFALELAPKIPAIERSVMFACWDGNREVRTELLNVIRKNVGTQTRIDSVRNLWGGHRWSYHFEGDN